MTKTFITSALALSFIAGTAMAQPPGGPGGPPRAQVPTDKAGNILKANWIKAGRPAQFFDMLDANKDGKLSPAEMQAARGAGGGRGPGGGRPQ